MRTLSTLALTLGVAAPAWSGELADSAFRSMRADRCEDAVDVVNKGLASGEVEAYHLTGLMYLKGLCLTADPAKAPRYFEPAAKAGDVASARYLAMMHGLGIGVPQSYAEAGRWTQAWYDILGLRNRATPERSLLDAEQAAYHGVLGTVAAAVQDRVIYPRGGARLQASEVNVRLVLQLGPEGLEYGFFDARSGIDDDIQTTILRRSGQPHLDAIEDAVDKVLQDLPAYPRPAKPQRIAIPYSFRLVSR